MELGLLDIGSNSARLEVVDLDRERLPRANWSYKARTRLAEHTGPDGLVADAGVEHAAEAVQRCLHAGRERLPRALVAYGTSAVRDARNGTELRRRLGEAAGIRIGVLSPRAEAALTYRGARRWHGRPGGRLTTVDIGGGTFDVVTGTGHRPEEVASFPFGAARLTRRYLPDDPPRAEQVAELAEVVQRRIHDRLHHYADADLGHPIAQSKVLRQLAVLTESSDGHVARGADRLVRRCLERWIPRLAQLDQKQRAALPGLSRGRAKRVLAGAIVADTVLRTIGVESLEICPWGLREGVVFRCVEACETARAEERPDAVRAVMAEMFA